jgi:hypothetical protein
MASDFNFIAFYKGEYTKRVLVLNPALARFPLSSQAIKAATGYDDLLQMAE